jgi:hypothetical protein
VLVVVLEPEGCLDDEHEHDDEFDKGGSST